MIAIALTAYDIGLILLVCAALLLLVSLCVLVVLVFLYINRSRN